MKSFKKIPKKALNKVRKLNDKDLKKIVEIFNMCSGCPSYINPIKCTYGKIRKKIGLDMCQVAEIETWERMKRKKMINGNLKPSLALNELKRLEGIIGRYLPKEEISRWIGKQTTKEFIKEEIIKEGKNGFYVVINKRTL